MYLSRIQLTEAFTSEPELANILRQNSYGMHQLFWKLFDDGSRHLFREESSRDQLGTSRNLPVYYVLSEQQPKQESAIFKVDIKPFHPQLQIGDRLSFRLRANPTVSRRELGKKNSSRHDVVMDAKYQYLLATCVEQGLLSLSDIQGENEQARVAVKQRFSKKSLQDKLFAADTYSTTDAKSQFFRLQEEVVEKAAQQWLIKRGEQHGFDIQSIQATGYQWHSLMKPKGHRDSGFSSMDYEGTLTVNDADVFLSMLHKGLGPSKGFGCGLMMIRRV